MKTLLVRLTGVAGAFALLASSALPAAAFTPRGGDSYLLPQQETINDDLYVGGATLILNGTVNGDVFAGGGTIVVNGPVKQDLTAAGGNITVAGDVGDDLRMGGGNLTLLKNVKGDVVMGGGNIIIGKEAVIERDLVVGAGSLVIEGTVKGNVRIGGGQVVLNGRVDGFIEVDAEDLRLGSDARLAKGLRYTSPKMATMDEGSKVTGEVQYVKMEERRGPPRLGRDARPEKVLGALVGFVALVFLVKMFALMIAAVVMVQLFKTYSSKLIDSVLNKPGKALSAGAITLIMVPVATIVLAITILGAPLAGILGFGYGFLVMMAKVYAGIVFGAWLWKLGSKGKAKGTDWKAAVVGTFLLSFICLIPIIGWIIGIVAFLAALGGLYMMTEEKIKAMK
ncbi:hypothetical protein IT087_02315 [Candidatus Uhrbacteria bacterium]|nr:hypothetical protein [Candidatus Uhrbacteria bacterium]